MRKSMLRVKILTIFILVLIIIIPYARAQTYRVAIFDYDDRINHEQSTAKYIEKQLKKIQLKIIIDQYSGKKDLATAVNVLQKLEKENYDLVITITSDALIIAHHILSKTPTLFTNVNNPLFLGFKHLGPPAGNISGVSYYISVEKQIRFYKSILPNLKNIGFIFDRKNKSKRVELPEARLVCSAMDIDHKIEVITQVNELHNAANRLIEAGVQALVIGSSDLLYNNISKFIDQCNTEQIPVFSFNKKGVQNGAVAALSSDYNLMVDELLIPMSVSVLKKEKTPGQIPIGFLKRNSVFINQSQTELLDLSIPTAILSQAMLIP